MRLKIFIITLVSLCWCTASADTAVSTEKKWYSIEYIVFENNLSLSQSGEPWVGTPLAQLENPLFIHSGNAKSLSIIELSPLQQQLQGVYSRLKKLTSYTPIRHSGWIQGVSRNSKINPLSILPAIEDNLLEGTISFHRERFLHIDVDLQLTETNNVLQYNDPSALTTNNEQATIFRLTESRRVKVDKLNYFDHPRFGVIVKVNKVDPPYSTLPATQPAN